MAKPIIIPQPQNIRWLDEAALPLPARITVPPDLADLERLAARRLAASIEAVTGRPVTVETHAGEKAAFQLSLDDTIGPAEAYRIDDDGHTIYLVGADPLGLSHAVETARQLLTPAGWPRCRIDDEPDYRHRGVFIESFWGTDRMTVADWQEFIDYLVSLKFNTLNVALHGCWEIKYEGVPTEFLMVPLRAYPQLQTPQTIRYLDPDRLTWIEETYVPSSFDQDFLPQVFAYARSRGMRIVPQFGGPAHNTLIPRLIPEISARNPDGSATHYGYCVSNPQTWAFLGTVIAELVERYAAPFQVAHFNIAGDEVYPIRNVLPEAPDAEVSPWCACPACRRLSRFEQLSAYLLGLAELLAAYDINAVVWADSLDRLGQIEAFKAEAARRGLAGRIVMQWWCYKEPLPTLGSAPELETWVEPSPGLIANLLYQDFSRNIYGFLQRGRAVGAAGVTAYNVPDLSLDKNYACLAEFSWNSDSGSLPHFHIRYARFTYGDDWRIALEAYDVAERIMGSYPLVVNMMDQLLPYFNTFPHGRVDYPLDVVRTLARDPLSLVAAVQLVEAHMAAAEQLLAGLASGGDIRQRFILECRRYRTLAAAYTAILDSLKTFTAVQKLVATATPDPAQPVITALKQTQQSLRAAHAGLRETMSRLKTGKALYLAPAALREGSDLLALLSQLAGEFNTVETDYTQQPQAGLSTPPTLRQIDLSELRALWHPWEF